MTRFFKLSFAILLTLTLTKSHGATQLKFIGDVDIKTGEKFQSTEIGGLSGIAYDKNQNKLLAISDDKSLVNESRFYEFDLQLTSTSFKLQPSAVVKLKNQDGKYFKKGYADFEGIALSGGDILVVSEGAINRLKPTAPELYRFTREGDFKKLLTIPEKFLLPKKDLKDNLYGSRDNLSFESLSITPDQKTIFLATEEAIFQDGPISTVSYGSHVRVIRYTNEKPAAEFAYPLEKVESLKSVDLSPGLNGLVDIAAINDKTFFSMERAYLPFKNKNVIRIFKCTIKESTSDISSTASLINANFEAIQKELVTDLEDFVPQLTTKSLDNIEGLALGPILPNGKRTLIVVSDNNFGKGQRTVFIAFELSLF